MQSAYDDVYVYVRRLLCVYYIYIYCAYSSVRLSSLHSQIFLPGLDSEPFPEILATSSPRNAQPRTLLQRNSRRHLMIALWQKMVLQSEIQWVLNQSVLCTLKAAN